MDRVLSLERRRIDLSVERPFALGPARIEPPAHEITWDGECRRLQPQPMKVLIALHDRLGQVVTRDELIERCWNGRLVGEDVIHRSISILRRVAAESGGIDIQTVPRGGYRLVEIALLRKQAPRLRFIAGALAAAAVLASTAAILSRRPVTSRNPTLTVLVSPVISKTNDPASHSLAVETHDAVVRILTASGLSVQTKSGENPVDFVVSSTIEGRPNGATANLRIEEPTRRGILFARTLRAEPAELGDFPDRIGANFAAPLSWTAPLVRLDQKHPIDPAFTAQLFDQVSHADFDMLRAYEFVRRNAPQAPDSAPAQLVLAMDTGLALDSLPVADRPAAVEIGRLAADRALRLAPEFGDTAIPWCLLHSAVQMHECENRLRIGMADARAAPFVPMFLSDLLDDAGRTEEALRFAADSLAQDQYVPAKIGRLVMLLEAHGDLADAERHYREGMRLWPDYAPLYWMRVAGIVQRGDLDALERLQAEPSASRYQGNHPRIAPLARAVRMGSLTAVKSACTKPSDDTLAVSCMITLARLGRLDDAYVIADKLYPDRKGRSGTDEERLWLAHPDVLTTAYLTGPSAASLRRDHRFVSLADRLGLLDYWRTGRLPDFCTAGQEPVCVDLRSTQARPVRA